MRDRAGRLHRAVSVLAPVLGVSVGTAADKTTWRINYAAEATPEHRAAVDSMLATWTAASLEPSTSGERSAAYYARALESVVAYEVLRQEALAEPDATKKAEIEAERDAALTECVAIARKIRLEIPD